MVSVGELVVLVFVDAGSVPGLYAEVWGRFRVQGPEGNGFKAGKSHLHTPARGRIKDGYHPGVQLIKKYSVILKHFTVQGKGTALQPDSLSGGGKVQLVQIIGDADSFFLLFKYQLVILKGKAILHGTVKSRMGADGIPHGPLVPDI